MRTKQINVNERQMLESSLIKRVKIIEIIEKQIEYEKSLLTPNDSIKAEEKNKTINNRLYQFTRVVKKKRMELGDTIIYLYEE